jgi:hypothetical protein
MVEDELPKNTCGDAGLIGETEIAIFENSTDEPSDALRTALEVVIEPPAMFNKDISDNVKTGVVPDVATNDTALVNRTSAPDLK